MDNKRMTYQIYSNVHSTRRHPSLERAIAAHERGTRRAGAPNILHYPPVVAGDTSETFGDGSQRHIGARQGHGLVFVEIAEGERR